MPNNDSSAKAPIEQIEAFADAIRALKGAE
jgi:hypothetical protein